MLAAKDSTQLKSDPDISVCIHCGKETARGAAYCCRGCESVHQLLVGKGLGYFYQLRDQARMQPVAKVAIPLENEASPVPDELRKARFYIEGIHCLGCLWLLEKLPEIDPRIEKASLDYSHGILEISREPEISWTEISTLIRTLGYNPKPLASDDGKKARHAEMVAQAIRLGVAGFSAGNIMLLTVAIYAGAEGAIARDFQLLSFALSLPALTYSAWPLYRSAWVPLTHGRSSVDLAISLALLSGIGLSVFNLIQGRGNETYFDSLTMLVFLLLASRFFLNRFRESLSRETPCLSFLSQQRYLRQSPNPGLVKAQDLRARDQILLGVGQTLPADARLSSGPAHFDFSLLTGESAPVKLFQGDTVEAGAKALEAGSNFQVLRPAAESRLSGILDQINIFKLARSPSLDFADRVGRRFVFVVLAIALALTLLLPFPAGFHRALVLVIVTCPCVLAFAVPLAFTRTLQQAARGGILFRASDKIEDLAQARTAFLDKTGTLTEGNFEVLEWEQFEGSEAETRSAVLALERESGHPVAKALVRYLDSGSPDRAQVGELREFPGIGVSGKIDSVKWEISRVTERETAHNLVSVLRDGVLMADISLGDQLRPEAPQFVAELRAAGIKPVILSGDTEARVAAVARATGISEWRSRLKPEEKAEIVKATNNSIM
ncbi:MAG: heavy metal translocating P-type ATPase, partial [Bdellovibrionota bacterium]